MFTGTEKSTVLWACDENKRITGTGHNDRTGRWVQETRKTMPKKMDSIKENMGFGLEKLKEVVKDRNKWRRLVEEKTRNREQTNIKR